MADKQDAAPQEEGFYAPNIKPAHLQEVEDDAVFITEKRIREQKEEQERAEARNKSKKGE